MTKINNTFRAIVPWSIRVRLPALIQAGAITGAVASFAPFMLSIAA
jgi:hypothetical protein